MIKKLVWKNDYQKVWQTYDFSLPKHKTSQCGIVIDKEGNISLVSYCTLIATFYPKYESIDCTFIDTATSRKHLVYFAEYLRDTYDINVTYQTFKESYLKDESITVYPLCNQYLNYGVER